MSDLVDQFKSYNGEKKFGEDTLYVRIPWDFRDEILAALSPPQDDELRRLLPLLVELADEDTYIGDNNEKQVFMQCHDVIERLSARVRTLEDKLAIDTLNPNRRAHIIELQERIAELEQALGALVALKAHKDIRGKDEHYLRNQPAAWDQAGNALNPPEES